MKQFHNLIDILCQIFQVIQSIGRVTVGSFKTVQQFVQARWHNFGLYLNNDLLRFGLLDRRSLFVFLLCTFELLVSKLFRLTTLNLFLGCLGNALILVVNLLSPRLSLYAIVKFNGGHLRHDLS